MGKAFNEKGMKDQHLPFADSYSYSYESKNTRFRRKPLIARTMIGFSLGSLNWNYAP